MNKGSAAKMWILAAVAAAAMLLGLGLGSVFITPVDILAVLGQKLLGLGPLRPVSNSTVAIFWDIRLPRAVMAFLVGGALSVSGVLMQSVLRNPLASSYTLGISSGAAVGASLAVVFGLNFLGAFTLPLFGLIFGMGTVLLAVGVASRLDRNLGNTTIILTGMAFSLFANAVISFLMAWAKEASQRILFWQMGSFAMKDWRNPAILLPVLLAGLAVAMLLSREMDMLTFGEEQAKTAGVEIVRVKWMLLLTGAVLTGCSVAMVGVIGFVDLFTPHLARRLFGSRHRLVVPAAALLGGAFMVLCDLVARTLFAPMELPVGAVTAALGAPFFLYLYFCKRR